MRADVSAHYAEILANERMAPEHYVLSVAAPEIAAVAQPGQFAMLRVPTGYDPLLPRAFSFYRSEPETGRVEFLYRVVGKGTYMLAQQQPGGSLHIWGPLGRGFVRPKGPALLVGGGVGVPPLVCLAEQARRDGWALAAGASMQAYFGFATAEFVVGAERIAAAGVGLSIATDDGSRGHHGYVTDLLRERLMLDAAAEKEGRPSAPVPTDRASMTVYACGPHPMLAAVARLCAEFGVASQLALEAPMACGVGACIGCTVPRREGGYARVCSDGPVFRAEEIAWEG